jgi:hypothetical protein
MKLTPLPNESAEAYLARQAIEDCATKYIATVGEAALTGRMKDSRENGAKAVFDLNAPHANGVLDAVAAKTGKSRSLLIVQDILACVLLETQTGVHPAAYVAHLTALRAAKAGLAALGYAVVDL